MPSRTRNSGKPSEAEFQRIFKQLGKRAHLHRLTDSAEVTGMNEGRRSKVKKQPADYVVTEDGEMYYAEVKSTHDPDRFKHSMLETNQKNAARKQMAAKGKYYVFVHWLKRGDWFKIPAKDILTSTKASFRWDEMTKYKWKLADVS